MVNTQELILGAKLRSKRHEGLIVDVVRIRKEMIHISANPFVSYLPEDFDPIEITPEILEKARFMNVPFQNDLLFMPALTSYGDQTVIEFAKLTRSFYITTAQGGEGEPVNATRINMGTLHLHQLQALHLFLTGKPLNIEL